MTERLRAPVDAAALAAFRILFGLLMCAGTLRFLLSGWVAEQYVRPAHFFKYPGFEWVVVPPEPALYALFGALAVLALMVALGLFYRVAIVLFCLGFSYVQLMDATNYLNHYYFIALVSFVMCFLPLHATWSLDARRRPGMARPTLPAWMLWLLRFQVATVYFHAALAKAQPDWLLHAQPLRLWLAARTDLPVIGPWLDETWVAYAMSWAGFLYDLTIVGFLLWRRTRVFAYVTVLVFHGLTHALFDIGMFPFIMVTLTPVFFAPDWPRRLLRRPAPVIAAAPAARWPAVAVTVWCVFHALFPLRHFAWPGDVLWNEEGMRWSWKVMVREKSGSVTFHVRSRETGRAWQVNPLRFLQWRQASEMAGQPDLIAQAARMVAGDFRARGFGDVEVRAEAWVSLNGRAPALLVDPDVDLSRVEWTWAPAAWIRPGPEGPPLAAMAGR